MKVTISYREFLNSLLLGARMLDECRPFLKTEEIVWQTWSFDDRGVHYVRPEERKQAEPVVRARWGDGALKRNELEKAIYEASHNLDFQFVP